LSLYTLKSSQNTVNSLELRDGFRSSEAVSEANCLVDDGQKRANSCLCFEMVEGIRQTTSVDLVDKMSDNETEESERTNERTNE
jgi:hypothetical protein